MWLKSCAGRLRSEMLRQGGGVAGAPDPRHERLVQSPGTSEHLPCFCQLTDLADISRVCLGAPLLFRLFRLLDAKRAAFNVGERAKGSMLHCTRLHLVDSGRRVELQVSGLW